MRQAFTLIEFILVITIIGVLLALSISNFSKILNDSSYFGNLSSHISIELAKNAYNLVPAAYLTNVDINERNSDITLKELITIKAKGWRVSADGNLITYEDSTIKSQDRETIELELSKDRKITLRIFCDKFIDLASQEACYELVPNKISTTSF